MSLLFRSNRAVLISLTQRQASTIAQSSWEAGAQKLLSGRDFMRYWNDTKGRESQYLGLHPFGHSFYSLGLYSL